MNRVLGLTLLLSIGSVSCSGGAVGPTQLIRRAGESLLEDLESIQVVSGEVRVDVITPSIDNLTDAADRTALVLAPPAEAVIAIPPGAGSSWLRPAAGVDLSVARKLLAEHGMGAAVTVRFELLLDGEPMSETLVRTESRAPRNDGAPGLEPHVWAELGPPGGVAVASGQRLTLRTSFVGPVPEGLGEILAGVAGLTLERRFEVPRLPAEPGSPNLVMVVMDTLRADRTSAYGYERPTTPNLGKLAEKGLIYDAAYATSSWTWPSTASILTGRLPEAHGVVDFRSCWLEDELVCLPEVLQEAGFTTAGFSGNPLISPNRNFDQGFEVFQATPDCAKSDQVVPPALAWLEKNRQHRFFLYLQLHDAHVPHAPRPVDLERFCGVTEHRFDPLAMQARTFALRNQKAHTPDDRPRPELLISENEAAWYSNVYDACVATGDYWLGVLTETLEDFGVAENTLLVVTSDHGEELLDHGMLNHNHALWQELVRAPLVFTGPGVPSGERVAVPVSNRHLAYTLASNLGVEMPGIDMAQDLLRPGDLVPRPVFFDTRHGWWKGRQFVEIMGVRDGDWVLHWCPEGRPWDAPPAEAAPGGESLLFDLGRDPMERDDLSAEFPDRAEAMRELLARSRAELAAKRPETKVRAGEATLEMLRQAGYAGGDDEQR